MPVQKHDARPVDRPAGLVPPTVALDGVTELRLHGVGGTSPENLLADAAPQLVSGDRVAGFYRTADLSGRHVEAYSWGGLTSRSASRVLWLLLLPFTLVNVAGWMCAPKAWRSPWRFRLHRAVVRWVALGMTVNLLLLVAIVTMDVLAWRCGAATSCTDRWWLSWLQAPALVRHPARRVLLGAAVPLLVVLGLLALSGRSLTRYERVAPPRHVDDPTADVISDATPARPRTGLDAPDFWSGGGSVANLALLHLGASLAFVAWAVVTTVRSIPLPTGTTPVHTGLADGVTMVAVVATLAALLLLTRTRAGRQPVRAVVALGVLALAAAVVFALAQPASGNLAGPAPPLPGMRTVVTWTFAGCAGSVIAVLASFVVGGHQRGSFRLAGPFVFTCLAAVVLNAVGIGTLIRVTDLLGDVPVPGGGPPDVYEVAYSLTPYLTLVPVAVLAGFGLVNAAILWTAAGPERRRPIRDEYAGVCGPDPTTVWDVSALNADGPDTGTVAGRPSPRAVRRLTRLLRLGWTARIARARRLASMARDVDLLLTLLAFVALVVAGYALVTVGVLGERPYAPRWALTLSTWLAAAAPLVVLLVMRRGWRGLDNRRHLGVLWDVGTFWPRAYHPLAPPSYAERAVPDLQRRLWRIHDNAGGVVLAAHSQGTVIAVAALLQETSRPRRDGRPCDDVALVTFGCPLATLYGRAFPAYFGADVLGPRRPRVWRWRNFHYDTDYIGGPVLPDDPGAGVDERLSDPSTACYVHGEEPPAPRRHSGYWCDERVWQLVDRWAAELPLPPGPARPGRGCASSGPAAVRHNAGVEQRALVRLSKRMSLALRHAPERFGLRLDRAGWVPVEELLAALGIRRADLDAVVAGNDKQRFAVERGADGVERIRASQGHSVPVELGLTPSPPPDRLHHGTSAAAVDSIRVSGLHRGSRHHVHLSPDAETARRVGARRGGAVVVLTVDAAAMARDGHVFYRSANGVWLTDAVPARYLSA